jgi:dipeptidyl aminopeptidase/acylaminoacyl peptidase
MKKIAAVRLQYAALVKVAHPNKIAVGGHSLGGFSTANLLAHAPHLFSCGVACSAADYRTLTLGFLVRH